MFKYLLLFLVPFFFCCDKATSDEFPPSSDQFLKVKIAYDSDQERLNNLGNTASIQQGRGTQNPDFRHLSVHFIELVPDEFTPYKSGQSIFVGQELPSTNSNNFGFTTAIDFNNAQVDDAQDDDDLFVNIPLSNLQPGTYRHARVSVSYQNYDVKFNINEVPVIGDLNNQTGTIASFLGYNTYLEKVDVNQMNVSVNDFKLQGFWAFETKLTSPYESYDQVFSGQAPEDATTVVNPFPNSPIPPGSCVISGSFFEPLVITGDENEDIELTFSFSSNQSFEWEDKNGNQEWDLHATDFSKNEPVVDMGLRGLKIYQN